MIEKRINNHWRETKCLEAKWEKQQVMVDVCFVKITALEKREEVREERIAIQEDMIQILSSEIEELREKMCQRNKSPHISQGSG